MSDGSRSAGHAAGKIPMGQMAFTRTRILLSLSLAVCLLLALFLASRVEIRGDYEGIYLLKGDTPWTFRITDDVFHGEQAKLLFSANLQPHSRVFSIPESHATTEFSVTCDWHEATGRGHVTSHYPNGTKLVTCFGRYLDGFGKAPSGLFVGGNLPFSVREDGGSDMNATGMAYFNGRRWNHVWCSVNEAILTRGPSTENISPSQWKFLGSRVLRETGKELVLTSSHGMERAHLSLLMERYAFFRAGDPYFVLVIRITNTGKEEATYSYAYGDEPWVGNYGSAAGDVGWVKDRIVYEEGAIDSRNHSYAGMFDYGNSLTGEGHLFTRTANFIQWLGREKPGVVFFSNKPGYFDEGKRPLTSDTRFFGITWGPEALEPGRSCTYVMAIGMAVHDPMTGFPVKPEVTFPQEAYAELVH